MQMTVRDAAKVLGISIDAPVDKRRHAYYSLVKKYHTDRNKTSAAAEEIRRINHAYGILTGKIKPTPSSHADTKPDSSYSNTTDTKEKSETFIVFEQAEKETDNQEKYEYELKVIQKQINKLKFYSGASLTIFGLSAVDFVVSIIPKFSILESERRWLVAFPVFWGSAMIISIITTAISLSKLENVQDKKELIIENYKKTR